MDYIVKLYKDWKLHSQFHEIVSDMEDESFFAEKQSIRDSGRSLKKYGSTCNHVRNSEHLVRHELAPTDTLQGIALKYGCTTEQIRRSNRLFAQDSLFLRQHLMIPVDKDSPHYPSSDSAVVDLGSATRPQSLAVHAAASHDTTDGSPASAAAADVVVLSPEEESRKDMDAFLGKIDSTLAQTRKYVAKSQNSFDFEGSLTPNSDDPYASNNRRLHMSTSSSASSSSHHNNQYQYQYHHHPPPPPASASSSSSLHRHHRNSSSGSSSTNNNNDTIELITMSSMQSRRVQSSLQRLEQQQDDFFKL